MQKLVMVEDKAFALCDKIAQHRPDRHFTVYGLGGSLCQVVEVRKLNGAGWAWNGRQWEKMQVKKLMASIAAYKQASLPVTTTITLPYAGESKGYLNVMQDGVVRYIGKTTLISYLVEQNTVRVELPIKVAQKRGMI